MSQQAARRASAAEPAVPDAPHGIETGSVSPIVVPRPPLKSEKIGVRRFMTADLSETGAWMLQRLAKAFPTMTHVNMPAFLAGVTQANDNLFIRTDNAVMLARINNRFLDRAPFVEEIFCFIRDGARDEAALLYQHAWQWAKSLGTIEMRAGAFSDLTDEQIASALGVEDWEERHSTAFVIPRE